MELQPSSNSCVFLPVAACEAECSDHCWWAAPCTGTGIVWGSLWVLTLSPPQHAGRTLLKRVGYHTAQTTFLTEQILKVTTMPGNSWPVSYLTKGKKKKNPTPQKANQQSLSLQTLRKIYLLWIMENWESACLSRCLWWLNAAIQSQQHIQNYRFLCGSLVSLQLIFTCIMKC